MTRADPCEGCDPDNPGGHLFPLGLDLGNGEAIVFGTSDDMRATADYLARHYPGGIAPTQGADDAP